VADAELLAEVGHTTEKRSVAVSIPMTVPSFSNCRSPALTGSQNAATAHGIIGRPTLSHHAG
jgi:hypothetical protein